jgi:hypothetical protein
MKVTSLDLFPTHVKIFDFEDDRVLNDALLNVARHRPELNSSTTGHSVLELDEPWVAKLRARYDQALRAYLGDTLPERKDPIEVEAYVFFNYTTQTSFTPVHDHLIEADLVAIYYAHAPEMEERHDNSYYAMDPGVLVLHDPRIDTRVDRRGLASRDHYRIFPRTNRMVLHPACMRHSVTPNVAVERLAVTCMFTVNRHELFEGYSKYRL